MLSTRVVTTYGELDTSILKGSPQVRKNYLDTVPYGAVAGFMRIKAGIFNYALSMPAAFPNTISLKSPGPCSLGCIPRRGRRPRGIFGALSAGTDAIETSRGDSLHFHSLLHAPYVNNQFMLGIADVPKWNIMFGEYIQSIVNTVIPKEEDMDESRWYNPLLPYRPTVSQVLTEVVQEVYKPTEDSSDYHVCPEGNMSILIPDTNNLDSTMDEPMDITPLPLMQTADIAVDDIVPMEIDIEHPETLSVQALNNELSYYADDSSIYNDHNTNKNLFHKQNHYPHNFSCFKNMKPGDSEALCRFMLPQRCSNMQSCVVEVALFNVDGKEKSEVRFKSKVSPAPWRSCDDMTEEYHKMWNKEDKRVLLPVIYRPSDDCTAPINRESLEGEDGFLDRGFSEGENKWGVDCSKAIESGRKSIECCIYIYIILRKCMYK
jgi:hypothetical protein